MIVTMPRAMKPDVSRRKASGDPARRERGDGSHRARLHEVADLDLKRVVRADPSDRPPSRVHRPHLLRGDDECLGRRLLGQTMPAVRLRFFDGTAIGTDEILQPWIALYFYPGTGEAAVATLHESARQDTAQHRAFSAREDELASRRIAAVGVSSQLPREQQTTVHRHRIAHRMLSDPALALARELGLPTFEHEGRTWYRRLTILAHQRVIQHVFHPVRQSSRNPSQLLSWMAVNAPPLRS